MSCHHALFGLVCRGVSSHRLVPGDLVVVLPGKATCDMVLLQGGCLVEESVLSGEVCVTGLIMPLIIIITSSVHASLVGRTQLGYVHLPSVVAIMHR